jgi:hypothetical protein
MNIKTLIVGAAVSLTVLASAAYAEDAYVVINNYSGNVVSAQPLGGEASAITIYPKGSSNNINGQSGILRSGWIDHRIGHDRVYPIAFSYRDSSGKFKSCGKAQEVKINYGATSQQDVIFVLNKCDASGISVYSTGDAKDS